MDKLKKKKNIPKATKTSKSKGRRAVGEADGTNTRTNEIDTSLDLPADVPPKKKKIKRRRGSTRVSRG